MIGFFNLFVNVIYKQCIMIPLRKSFWNTNTNTLMNNIYHDIQFTGGFEQDIVT